jgi:hypothetical protein
MDISATSSMASMANAVSKASFGAQVVSKSLDYMNGGGGSSSSSDLVPTDKQSFGAQVVSKTLDYMNSGQKKSGGMGSMSQMYNFNKDVLGSMMSGKGIGLDTSV